MEPSYTNRRQSAVRSAGWYLRLNHALLSTPSLSTLNVCSINIRAPARHQDFGHGYLAMFLHVFDHLHRLLFQEGCRVFERD